jgi:hypothetical protein
MGIHDRQERPILKHRYLPSPFSLSPNIVYSFLIFLNLSKILSSEHFQVA